MWTLVISVRAQDEKYFVYGSIYTGSIVETVIPGAVSAIERLEGISAYIFFHQYLENGEAISYWTIMIDDGRIYELEEGVVILGYESPGSAEPATDGYLSSVYTFSKLHKEDMSYDGVLYNAINSESQKLIHLEIWDFDDVITSIKNLKNIGKYEKEKNKGFFNKLKEIKKISGKITASNSEQAHVQIIKSP
ncbi:MAG: hypothetical protein DRI54_07580 [Bacteroidetes bacterium]|nr:MAG: hypothetical protein DRI54_07580 [Bacteroidota bacterium]